MIRLKGIERHYENRAVRTYVLRSVSLQIEEGEFVTVMGPSGAGKTTLLSILGLLDHGWAGEYWFRGEAVHGLRPKRRQARVAETLDRFGIVGKRDLYPSQLSGGQQHSWVWPAR